VPFAVNYSMFGFPRAAGRPWAFGDGRGWGFVLAATPGRTTLQGEGLQHCDGQSLLHASVHPSCRAYDPAFAYEVAVSVHAGMATMHGPDPQDVLYYLTLYNENYPMPAMPIGVEEGVLAGLYRYAEGPTVPGTEPASSPPGWRFSPRSKPRRSSPSATTPPRRYGARRATRRCAKTRSPPSAGTGSTLLSRPTVPTSREHWTVACPSEQ